MSIAELKEFFPVGWELVLVAAVGLAAAAIAYWLTNGDNK